MGKHKSINEFFDEYNDKYGDIPLPNEIGDRTAILDYLRDKYKRIDDDVVLEMVQYIESIPWETEKHIIPIIPKPAARPRYSFETKHFYVPGASDNKTIMKKILGISPSLILARTEIRLDIYQPTPCYKMNQNEIYVAELGHIRPLIDPDVDNFAKAYLDAIQGVLIADDNIITGADFEKYFSVKPRIELILRYQTKFDSRYTEKVITDRLNKL